MITFVLRGNYGNIQEQDRCRLLRVTEEGLKERLVGKWVINKRPESEVTDSSDILKVILTA